MAAAGAEVVRTPADAMMHGRGRPRRRDRRARRPAPILPRPVLTIPSTRAPTSRRPAPRSPSRSAGRIDAWVAGVGTTRNLHRRGALPLGARIPALLARRRRAAGLDPRRRRARPHEVEGIGLSQIWPILDRAVIDEVVTVPRRGRPSTTCRALAREEGLFVGGSSGAAADAALRDRAAAGPRQDRRHALPGRRGALSGPGNLRESHDRKDRTGTMGFSTDCIHAGQRARSHDRGRLRPDLPDLDLRPGGARQEQGLRVRAHAEPDARGARGEPHRPRGRRRRAAPSPRAWRRSRRSRPSSSRATTSSART